MPIPDPVVGARSPDREGTITGSNFTDATSVQLGTTSTFVVNSSNEIRAVVPTIARGYYKWSVTTASGTATSSRSFRVR